MVNSASQSLAEFKSQKLGGLLSGYSSVVDTPSIVGTSLSDTASQRMARSAPKKSSTAFMDNIRQSGQRLNSIALSGYQAQARAGQQAQQQAALAGAIGAMTGASGLASGSKSYPASGYRQPAGGGGERKSKQGSYGYQPFAGRYGLTVPASNALTSLEGAYKKQFGSGFVTNNGWRSVAEEAVLWDRYKAGKGPIASKPGTGVHGYGTAVDINGPISNANSKQHAWLRQNAAQYGWYWVGQRFGEAWHWEYYG